MGLGILDLSFDFVSVSNSAVTGPVSERIELGARHRVCAYLYLEEVLGRAVDFFKGLLPRVWHRLHLGGCGVNWSCWASKTVLESSGLCFWVVPVLRSGGRVSGRTIVYKRDLRQDLFIPDFSFCGDAL